MSVNQKIVIQRIGESFRRCTELVKQPLPQPGPSEVLVQHHFAGVNGVYDQMMCANKVDHIPTIPPADTGVEAIGMVVKTGQAVVDHHVGDAVATIGSGGGYCLYKCCDQAKLIPVPTASREILALIPSGVSALLALERTGEMTSGETVCITAAAGGLGNIAVQLAVNAGNHVIAVCGSDAKARWLHSQGVARVINYRTEQLGEVLKHEYPDAIDVALDSLGGDTFDTLLEQLAPHGRLVVCGQTTDRLPPARVTQERVYTRLYWKAASVRGFMNYRFVRFADDARRRLISMVNNGEITPLIDSQTFTGLEQVPDAVEHLLAGNNIGKVFVDLSEAVGVAE